MFTRDIGVDLGTANTLVCLKGKGIIMREPSVVAYDIRNDAVRAVGTEAKEMIGRTPGSIVAVRPLKDGVIADFDVTAAMLKRFVSLAMKGSFFSRVRMVICIPAGVTEVESRAVYDAAKQAGASDIDLVEEPMAAAVGAGLPVWDAAGNMVVDIGGGTSEVAVISLGDIVTSRSLRIAGDELNEAIVNYIRKEYNVLIGEPTAERVKIEIGATYPLAEEEFAEICGRDLMTGLPKFLTISSRDVRIAMTECINSIVDAVKMTLEDTPPELSADIMDHGIVLTGGGALIRGLDTLLSRETGMPVIVAEDPLSCVALGAGIVIDELEILKSAIFKQ